MDRALGLSSSRLTVCLVVMWGLAFAAGAQDTAPAPGNDGAPDREAARPPAAPPPSQEELQAWIGRLQKTLGPQLAPHEWKRAMAVAERAKELAAQGEAEQAKAARTRVVSLLDSIEKDHRMGVDAGGSIVLGSVTLHRGSGEISFPGKLRLESEMFVELIVCTDGADRSYETLLTTPARAIHLQTMLVLSGARNGPAGWVLPGQRQGDVFDIDLEYTGEKGKPVRRPVEDFLKLCETGEKMPQSGWVFVGSSVHDGRLVADITGELILSWRSGPSIIQSGDPQVSEGAAQIEADDPDDIGHGTKVRIILKPRRKKKGDAEEQ